MSQNKFTYIGIRAEDKSHWERRVALIPEHINLLKSNNPNLQFIV